MNDYKIFSAASRYLTDNAVSVPTGLTETVQKALVLYLVSKGKTDSMSINSNVVNACTQYLTDKSVTFTTQQFNDLIAKVSREYLLVNGQTPGLFGDPTINQALDYFIANGAGAGYQSANSRLFLSNGNPTSGLSLCYGNTITMISPAWDIISPRVGFAGFVGKTGFGESAVGNDVQLDGCFIEIAGTKNWVSVNGSKTTQTATPSLGGAFTAQIPNGSHLWTDENTLTISANSTIRIGWATTVPTTGTLQVIGGPYPVPTAYYPGSGGGDYTASSATTRLTAIGADTTGNITIVGNGNTGYNNAPVAFIAKPNGAPAIANSKSVLIAGMSIDWGANVNQSPWALEPSFHLAMGGFARGLNSTTTGRIPFTNLAVPGSRMLDLVNAGGAGGGSGEAGWAMRNAMMAAVGFPWTTVLMGGPINDVANYTSGVCQTNIAAALAAMKARSNRRTVMTTMRPQTVSCEETGTPTPGAANGYAWTGGDTHQSRGGSDVVHEAIDTFIMGGVTNLDAVIDIRPAHESSTGSRKWKEGVSSGTLTTATTGAATGVVGGTGGVSSTTYTVTAITTGTLQVGSRIQATGIPSTSTVYIESLGTGSGGTGTYILNQAVTVAAATATTVSGQFAIFTSAAPTVGDFYVIDPQMTSTASTSIIVQSVSGVGPYTVVLKSPGVTKAHSIGATIVGQWSNDGTHCSPQGARAEGPYIDTAKGTAIQ
jgi:hypothetical protein